MKIKSILRVFIMIYMGVVGSIAFIDSVLSFLGNYSKIKQGVFGPYATSVIFHYNISNLTNWFMLMMGCMALFVVWVLKTIK